MTSQLTSINYRPTELTIDPSNKFGYSLDAAVDSRLAVNVVVLDSIKEPRQAPERIGFHGI